MWKPSQISKIAECPLTLLGVMFPGSGNGIQTGHQTNWNNFETFRNVSNCVKFVSRPFCMPLPLPRSLSGGCFYDNYVMLYVLILFVLILMELN